MVILGLLLIGLGAIAILSAFFVSEGQGELLGMDLTTLQVFLVGVVAGAFLIWGFAILKFGTRRELRQRRERREVKQRAHSCETGGRSVPGPTRDPPRKE